MKFKRIYIEITNICNMKCSFCSPLIRTPKTMSILEFEHIVSEVAPYEPHLYFHVKGEPLMHPNLAEFLDIAQKYNLPVNITTNGTLIKNQENLLLEHKAVRQVNLSVHSLDEQGNNNKSEYLKSLVDFGLKAKELGKPYVTYRMWNGLKDQEISEDALDKLNFIANYFDVKIDGFNMLKGRNAAKLGNNIYISFMDRFVWPSLSLPYVSTEGKCRGGRDMLAILVDGTIVPCCLDSDGIINLGNIFTEKLENILKSSRYLNLKNGFTGNLISEELCKKCSYRKIFDKNS